MALQAQPLARRVGARRVRLAVTRQVLPDQAGEAARVDGLLDEAVAPDGEARVAIALGGDGDDGHAAERRLAAQAERHLVAVEPGDVEVDEDQVGPLRQRRAHALEAVGGVDDLVPLGGEELAHEQAVPRVVLDVKNARHSMPWAFDFQHSPEVTLRAHDAHAALPHAHRFDAIFDRASRPL